MIYKGDAKLFDTSELKRLKEMIDNDQDELNSSSNSSFAYRLEKYLASSGIGDVLDLLNASGSILFVIFYCYLTYQENIRVFFIDVLEITLLIFISMHYLLRLFTSKNRLFFLSSLETVLDVGTVACIFMAKYLNETENTQMIYYLNLSRMLRLLYLYKLENIAQKRFDETVRYTYKLFFSLFAIIFISSSLILEFENAELRSLDEKMLSFHDTLYYMLVTLSTIGFGDIVPITVSGRFIVIITILIILGVIPALSQKLITVRNLTSKYKRITYTKRKRASDHLLLTGTCKTEGFVAFLKELYHEDHGNVEYHTIILQNQINDELMMTMKELPFSSKIMYLMGNSLTHKDLERCKADTAKCVVFLANKLAKNAKFEDFSNILQAFAVKKYSKMYSNMEVRVCLQLLRPDTKEIYFSSLLDKDDFNTDDQVICVEELKLQLLGKSCICPGINTIISTLITSDKPARFSHKKEPEWVGEYLEGSQIEIYRIGIKTEVLQGTNFIQIVRILYVQIGIIMIGVDICSENGELEVCINPNHYTFPLNDVGQKEQFVYVLADSLPDSKMVNSEIEQSIKSEEGESNFAEIAKAQKHKRFEVDEPKDSSQKNSKKKGNLNKNMFNLTSEPRTVSEAERFDMETLNQHIIICGLIQNMKNLILPLRTNNIKHLQHPILIIDKEDHIPSEIWKEIQYFPDIYYLQGNPIKSKDLSRANIKKAKSVIILSNNTFEEEANDLIDTDTIFIYKAIRNEEKDMFILVELSSINTLSYISSNEKSNFDKLTYRLTEQYAVGEIYTSSMLDTLMCQSFYNPHITKILQQLIMGNSTANNFGDPKKESYSLHSQSTLYLLNINEELKKYNESSTETRKPYGEIFLSFLKYKMIPIGVYRYCKIKTTKSDKIHKYVYLCPDKDTMINVEEDKIYVLANEEENIVSTGVGDKNKNSHDKYFKNQQQMDTSNELSRVLLNECKEFLMKNQDFLNSEFSIRKVTADCCEVIRESMSNN